MKKFFLAFLLMVMSVPAIDASALPLLGNRAGLAQGGGPLARLGGLRARIKARIQARRAARAAAAAAAAPAAAAAAQSSN